VAGPVKACVTQGAGCEGKDSGMSKTWIIIVNYRTAGLVIDCLDSLSSQVNDLGGGRILVVDNCSGDDSVERLQKTIIQKNWSGWVDVLPQEMNGGFAYGNNAGIRTALSSPEAPDYIMLLNPDTLVRKGAVSALAGFMDEHTNTGISGSLLENEDGSVECSAHRMHSPLGELDAGARLGVLSRILHNYVVSEAPAADAHCCEWVSGASMMIRRQVLEQVGYLDEGFFLYFEEVDFCTRARRQGWEVWYVPCSRVMHMEGASTGIRTVATRRACYWYDSRRRFFIKYYGVWGLIAADLLWLAGRSSFLVRKMLRLGSARRDNSDPLLFSFDLLWGDIRAILSGKAAQLRMEK